MGRTIVFGGTFDPIHHGHLITAQAAREALGAQRVLFVPAAVSPHKLGRVSAGGADRLAMVRAAIAGETGFACDDMELTRPGPSYTVDTIAALTTREPATQWVLLIGADQLPTLPMWRRAGELLAMVQVAVLGRPGEGGGEAAEHEVLERVRRAVGAEHAGHLPEAFLRTPRVQISATEIRRRVAAGLSIRYLVPEAVAEYIAQHGLYREGPR